MSENPSRPKPQLVVPLGPLSAPPAYTTSGAIDVSAAVGGVVAVGYERNAGSPAAYPVMKLTFGDTPNLIVTEVTIEDPGTITAASDGFTVDSDVHLWKLPARDTLNLGIPLDFTAFRWVTIAFTEVNQIVAGTLSAQLYLRLAR